MIDDKTGDRSADDGRGAEGAATSPQADLNSRIERRLWVLQRGTDRAEARMCAKFGRREFRVYVNGGLLWSRNYAMDETRRFDEDAAAKFAEFATLGWEDPGATVGE